jgi:pyrroline-5-carboxylate reductase
MRVAVIGGGNLGSALAKALSKRFDVVVTRRNPEKIVFLRDLGCEITRDNVKAVEKSDLVILTVKRGQVFDVLNEIPDDRIP